MRNCAKVASTAPKVARTARIVATNEARLATDGFAVATSRAKVTANAASCATNDARVLCNAAGLATSAPYLLKKAAAFVLNGSESAILVAEDARLLAKTAGQVELVMALATEVVRLSAKVRDLASTTATPHRLIVSSVGSILTLQASGAS